MGPGKRVAALPDGAWQDAVYFDLSSPGPFILMNNLLRNSYKIEAGFLPVSSCPIAVKYALLFTLIL